jgi:hypothetical protein
MYTSIELDDLDPLVGRNKLRELDKYAIPVNVAMYA